MRSSKNCMFIWLTVLLKKIPNKIPRPFHGDDETLCLVTSNHVHIICTHSLFIHVAQPVKWDFGVIFRERKTKIEKESERWVGGWVRSHTRLNYYGEQSSVKLALKLLLFRQNIVLRSTVLMLMPWNILNWGYFANNLSGDKIRYEKKILNRVIWSCRKIYDHGVDLFSLLCLLWPSKIQRISQITMDFRIFQTSVSQRLQN